MAVDEQYYKAGAILLPGVVTLPHNAIPLHIFEERYREMLRDALASNAKFIIGTMIDEKSDPLKTAVLVEVVANEALEDGRSLLVVAARERVEIVSWDKTMPYPRAMYRKLQRSETAEEATIITLLKDSFESTLTRCSDKERKFVMDHLDTMESLEQVIDVVAQYSIRKDEMRRYFLEEHSDSERASKLLLELEAN